VFTSFSREEKSKSKSEARNPKPETNSKRIKICRKEAKESRFWLRLVEAGGNSELEGEREELINESQELMNIFGAILQKVK
jgi:four helix bundle protein